MLRTVRVCLGDLLVLLHVVERTRVLAQRHALTVQITHCVAVVAHDVGELVPLLVLRSGDLELGMQFRNTLLDACFTRLAACRIRRRCACGRSWSGRLGESRGE